MSNPACYNAAELVQDHNVREELLIHIAKEATAVRDAGWRALKVVSDIDDTFLCSGGSFPSGTVTLTVNAAYGMVLECIRTGWKYRLTWKTGPALRVHDAS